jgi:PAS domain S-box-containing protein
MAAQAASKEASGLRLDPDAGGPGIRDKDRGYRRHLAFVLRRRRSHLQLSLPGCSGVLPGVPCRKIWAARLVRRAELFGYERKELIGRPVDSLVPFDVQAAHQGYRAAYNQAPQARPMGERARLAGLRKDGATLPVEISLSPVLTATDNFVLAVIRDATEARRRDDLADLARAAVTGQSRRMQDLLDRVVHRLFQVGLSLQAAADVPGVEARERISEALVLLDDTIREIRDYALTSRDEGPLPEPGPPSDAT